MTKKILSFNELDQARRQLGLDERSTLNEIKTAYHLLVKKYHPDRNQGSEMEVVENMKRINRAYHLIMDYCRNYRFSFLKQDFELNYPELNFQERFKDDWLSS